MLFPRGMEDGIERHHTIDPPFIVGESQHVSDFECSFWNIPACEFNLLRR